MTGTETGVEAEAGYLGLQVISRWTAEGAEGAAGKGRWEEAHGVVEFDRARIAGSSGGQQERWFEALSARIERGQHTLVVGGSKQRRAALGAVLAGPDSCGLLVGGRVRSPRAHSGVARVAGGRRPYVRGGSSLWDLLVFPHDKAQSLRRGVEERHLAELLRCLEFGFLLAHVGSDWGKVIDWAKVLDRRGCAALAVCRVLYHAPEFAVIDDEALRELLPDQVRRVVAVANRHRTTIVVLAEADPFDDSPPLSPPQSAASSVSLRGTGSSSGSGDDAGFYACIGEFSRALRLRGARVWEFCSFGYGSAQRAAFDVAAARKWVWAADSDDGGQGFRSTLRRMPSTLSQCTTTERHWLVTPEYPLSPAGADRSGSSL
ncbi:ATP-binding cassette long-chain fatty acid transporter pxa2, partial [Coemansia spiralis]